MKGWRASIDRKSAKARGDTAISDQIKRMQKTSFFGYSAAEVPTAATASPVCACMGARDVGRVVWGSQERAMY